MFAIPELGTRQPTQATIGGWKINVFNCQSRVGWYKVTARHGCVVDVKDRLTPEALQQYINKLEGKK